MIKLTQVSGRAILLPLNKIQHIEECAREDVKKYGEKASSIVFFNCDTVTDRDGDFCAYMCVIESISAIEKMINKEIQND